LFEVENDTDAMLYLIVPHGSRAWYAGITAARRKRGSTTAPGILIRTMEHLAGIARGAGQGDPVKYKVWKALGCKAAVVLPIRRDTLDRITKLEDFIIAKEQPRANMKGRSSAKKGEWARWNQNRQRGTRPQQWRRPVPGVSGALANNFWLLPRAQEEAFEATWRTHESRESRKERVTTTEPLPFQVDLTQSFLQNYREYSRNRNEAGPWDIYGPSDDSFRLLASYTAGLAVPQYRVQTERIKTSTLMRL
jgi:hypothetical protein